MLKEALDDVLERYYRRIDINPAFKSLALGYGGVKNDDNLREMILSLLRFVKSMAYPAKWLNDAVREYRKTAETGSLGQLWTNRIQELAVECGRELDGIYNAIEREIDNCLFEDHPYNVFFKEEADVIKRLFDGLEDKDYTYIRSRIYAFSFPILKSGIRGAEGELAAAQDKIKAFRDKAKKCLGGLKDCFKFEEKEVVSRIALSYHVLRTLKNIVLTVDRAYTKRKRNKNYLDFNDLEHEALKLLVDKNGNPKETAVRLRQKYKEILIDEYQDTNNIQDTIFNVISRDNTNIFMVGDLKQSIYKFRNAVPALFSDKYTAYAEPGNNGHLIRLFKNFRSRKSVVDTVNYIFESIMSREIGDVDYTEEEYLIQGATYPEDLNMAQFETELHMICRDSGEEETTENADKTELEAYVAVKRIKEIICGEMMVFDKETGSCRSAQYRDVVILMRNTKKTAPVFERILEENGIPVYTDIGKSYLSSVEVQTVLSFLQIIDNPLQDIPLIAVLRSPIWNFSNAELAHMRSRHRDGYFFDALSESAENGNEKAKTFLESLGELRSKAEYTGVDGLIHSIYYEYGYYAYSGAMSHGAMRQANLRLLFERAAEFEHSKMSGLFSFMNYIETIRKSDDDLTPAKAFGEGENVVRIMSIHKSKGLEFPVVILADTAHRFNTEDMKKRALWHEDNGLGMDYTDTKLRVRYPSLPRTLISVIAKSEIMSEEMRLLYVALTRAREKLIITATFSGREKNWRVPMWDRNGRTLMSYVKGSQCFRDWLTAALMRHPGAKPMREFCGVDEANVARKGTDFGLKVVMYSKKDIQTSYINQPEINAEIYNVKETVAFTDVEERLSFEYPHMEKSNIPIKMSVSEVKRMQSEDGEYVPLIESLQSFEMLGLEGVTAAERGTVTHFVLQYADEHKIRSDADVEQLVSEMKRDGIITQRQAESIDCKAISRFFESELGERMRSADRVEKEFSFYTDAAASEIYQNNAPGSVLLQGAIDCFMINGSRVTLVDFKTDRVRSVEDALKKAQKYKVQMKYYKKGLKEILGQEIDECYLYFLDIGETVKM